MNSADWLFIILFGLGVVGYGLMAFAYISLADRVRDMELREELLWQASAEQWESLAAIRESRSLMSDPKSTTQPDAHPTLDAMDDDTQAHGGHVRYADWLSDQERGTSIAEFAVTHLHDMECFDNA